MHGDSFGDNAAWYLERPKVIQLDRGVRFERWIPADKKLRAGAQSVDYWHPYDYMLPGILLALTYSYPIGTAAASDFGPPDPSLPVVASAFSGQAVTPMTEEISRYFFSLGPHRDSGDENARDAMCDMRDHGPLSGTGT